MKNNTQYQLNLKFNSLLAYIFPLYATFQEKPQFSEYSYLYSQFQEKPQNSSIYLKN
jgi:hypothetical protein